MAAAALPLHFFNKVENKEELLKLVIEPILEKFKNLVGLENEDRKNAV